MFAIMNIKTNEFVYGTDFRFFPHHQRTSKNQMLTFPDKERAFYEFKHRQCGKNYRVVVLKTIEVKRVLEVSENGKCEEM